MKILIVEDDEMLGKGLQGILQLKQYEARVARCVAEAEQMLREFPADLYILDYSLPDGDGISLCRRIRTVSQAPILFLTVREEEFYVVEGLQSGADDYVVKPFRTMELLARIEALLRRKQPAPPQKKYKSGSLVIDPEAKACKRGSQWLIVPAEEWQVLWCLVEAKGDIVRREELCRNIWKDGAEYVEENTLRVLVSRLRRHLKEMGMPEAIETCRGVGYRWILPVEAWDE